MALTDLLVIVNLLITLIAIVVALIYIPKIHSKIVSGWKIIVLSLVIFAITQILIATNANPETIAIFNTIFIFMFIIGLFVHLLKLAEYRRAPQRG